MASFSERHGYRTPRASIGQFESMDDHLRAGLWNFLGTYYWQAVHTGYEGSPSAWGFALLARVWDEVFGLPSDSIRSPLPTVKHWKNSLAALQRRYFVLPWNEVYDLVEFIVQARPRQAAGAGLNALLEREGALYRLVAGSITPITSSEEITEIGVALNQRGKFAGCSTHLQTALNLLADREKPDYRNSVKESISAVEAAVRVITGKPKATLGEGLKAVGADTLHPALSQAWDKMYGWTSDGGGIRHALGVDADPDLPVARYMLVACSAFVNYLIARS